jgi:hypothetical protein
VHSERLQHFGSRAETDRLTLQAHRKRGEINRHDSVLTKAQTIIRMAGDLQNKIAVPPFVQRLAGRGFRTGSPQRTNGLELNPTFCFPSSRFQRTMQLTSACRSFCFETTTPAPFVSESNRLTSSRWNSWCHARTHVERLCFATLTSRQGQAFWRGRVRGPDVLFEMKRRA